MINFIIIKGGGTFLAPLIQLAFRICWIEISLSFQALF